MESDRRSRTITEIIRIQSIILLQNTENILLATPENIWLKPVNGYPMGKQLYHLLNSLDRIFAPDPEYQYPEFHMDGMNRLDSNVEPPAKTVLTGYFRQIGTKIGDYLSQLDDMRLTERLVVLEMSVTRLDLILSQFRHATWHIAYLDACLKGETGSMPEYIGLDKKNYPLP